MNRDRQVETNQLNAPSSTGPRTLIRNVWVSSNALKHGMTGQHISNQPTPTSHRKVLFYKTNPFSAALRIAELVHLPHSY